MTAPAPGVRRSRDRPTTPRLLRELRTLEAMTAIYCRDRHGGEPLCESCQALMTYAAKRLAVCPFGEDKPVCAKCQIHCYGPKPREEVRIIMRYAGPRMTLRHPWLALGHLLDKRYPAHAKPRATSRGEAARGGEHASSRSARDRGSAVPLGFGEACGRSGAKPTDRS